VRVDGETLKKVVPLLDFRLLQLEEFSALICVPFSDDDVMKRRFRFILIFFFLNTINLRVHKEKETHFNNISESRKKSLEMKKFFVH
jgi:hypothetical protein